MEAPKADANDPSRKGALASDSLSFGEFKRYSVAAVHTRFDAVQWFVKDAEGDLSTGLPVVIRQEATFEEAVSGLVTATAFQALEGENDG